MIPQLLRALHIEGLIASERQSDYCCVFVFRARTTVLLYRREPATLQYALLPP